MSHPIPSPAATSEVSWADPARQALFNTWMAGIAPAQGLLPATVRIASADASFRRYLRVDTVTGDSRIVMDAPPDKENSKPFVQIAALMKDAGLRAPVVLDWHEAHGFMLLNDLGSETMMSAIDAERPQANHGLYMQAVDTLIQWQLASRPGVLPPYDEALLHRELALFPEWCVARHAGIELTEKEQGWLDGVMEALVASALAQPQVFVHRDYMPRNMMLTDDLSTPAILDFQDAVYGPITYDVVSLFRDAFISWDEERELDWVIRYWEQARKAGLPVHADFGDFWRAYEFMGLQRHLKVLGIFCRLNYRDGKGHYLEDLPRFFNYAYRTAERYAELRPLVPILERLSPRDLQIGYTF